MRSGEAVFCCSDPHTAGLMSLSSACERALRHLVLRPCVCLVPRVAVYCRPVTLRRQSDRGACGHAGYGTWQPAEAVFFTIMKDDRGDTLLYCHINDSLYYASPAVQLSRDAPVGIALLGQWCEDKPRVCEEGSGSVDPHLLIFDVLSLNERNPERRGEFVRGLESVLPKPTCVVQWAGDTRALSGFVRELPHAVQAVLKHTADPFVVISHPLVD